MDPRLKAEDDDGSGGTADARSLPEPSKQPHAPERKPAFSPASSIAPAPEVLKTSSTMALATLGTSAIAAETAAALARPFVFDRIFIRILVSRKGSNILARN